MASRFFLCSRSFIIFHFPFRSVIHFELFFVKGMKSVSRFISLQVGVQLFKHYVKLFFSPYCISFVPLSKISCLYLYESISGLPILFYWSGCLFWSIVLSPVPYCLNYCIWNTVYLSTMNATYNSMI